MQPKFDTVLDSELASRLSEIACTPILLVATDFDGTLAPIATSPQLARPNREAMVALGALALLPQTHAAIISGRAIADLASVAQPPEQVSLVGSHGSEFDPGWAQSLDPELIERRETIRRSLLEIADSADGLVVEAKPAAVALHFRSAAASDADRALSAVMRGPATFPDTHVKHGKKVVELSVIPTNKGSALRLLRQRVGASAVVFLGDDESDEDAFVTLHGPDLGIKVGDGETRAHHRTLDTLQTARLLARLLELRRQWVCGGTATPIEHHALLSDQRTVALVNRDGRVVWMCAPRIDSPALFGELVGGPAAGYFLVRPEKFADHATQCYLCDTLVLKSTWPTISVTDYLDCGAGRPFQRAGRTDLIRVVEGTGTVLIEFAPRLDFGREPTHLQVIPDGLRIGGSLDPIVLRSPGVEWRVRNEGSHHTAAATVLLDRSALVLELRYGLSSQRESVLPEAQRRAQSERFWRVWAEQLVIPDVYPALIRRSALTIRALSYGPTGAVCAAATTSLPETIGGTRNWDYRYCWLRDAAMAASTLARLGNTGQGIRLLDWLLGILDRTDAPEQLRPVYTVTGEHLPPEAEIAELAGYQGSRPVRIGNAAAQQLQLDVFGPIVELIALLAERGAALSAEQWRLVEKLITAVSLRWREPDHGIWEVRQTRRHYVHSKAMCWMAVDRAIQIGSAFSGSSSTEWQDLRECIRDDVLQNGWSTSVQAFTSSYGDHELDASSLVVGLCGLVAPDDERFVKTTDAVQAALQRKSTVLRYRFDDSLPGEEGGFQLCTAWLIEALAMIGRGPEAAELLDAFARSFGPTGLASEELCHVTGRALGNYPQVYTHLGFCNAALRLAAAGHRRAVGQPS